MKRTLLVIVILLAALFIFLHKKMNTSNASTLQPLLEEVENNIANRDAKNTAVSQADVAWQLDHVLKVINRISDSLVSSNPKDYKSSINAGRVLVLGSGYIPRGVAQTPDVVRPPERILTEDLHQQLKEALKNIETINALPDKAHFTHFSFGCLDKVQTIRFLEVHTKHHLKIIRDILK